MDAQIQLMGFGQDLQWGKEVKLNLQMGLFGLIQCTIVVASLVGCIIDINVSHACTMNVHKVLGDFSDQ